MKKKDNNLTCVSPCCHGVQCIVNKNAVFRLMKAHRTYRKENVWTDFLFMSHS